jgi:2-polyprenyl-6-methoxyphenol hydroxylase-like FAD-dependent oxidoreductase
MGAADEPVVIVGGGLTGMAISATLTEAAIPHVLVGSAPDSLPRLGESLNLEGTILIDQFCSEFKSDFLPKHAGLAYMGDHVLTCDFNVGRKRRSRGFFKLLGTTAPAEFLHIDRLALDTAMWERTIASPYCRVANGKVEGVSCDGPLGRVTSIEVSDGSSLTPRYVFDASNHRRVIAQAIGVDVRMLGQPQRGVYTHYHPPGRQPLSSPRAATDLSTNLLRLFKSIDGIEAMAWYIPLPNYISIGVSMDEGTNELSDADVLDHVEAAYARRGLAYRTRFPEASPVMTLHHRYYAHERAYGPNWVLAGATYASVWWLAGAGVGTSFVAGRMAADLVRDPEGTGHAYQEYLKDLVPIHDTFDWFVYAPLEQMTERELIRQSDRFVRTNVSRLASASRLGANPVSSVAGMVLGELVRREVLPRHYCEVSKAALSVQTERAFGPETQPDDEAVVLRLAEVIAGRLEPGWVEHLLSEDVVSHLDGLTAKGVQVWKEWLWFLRTRPGMGDVDLVDVQPHTLADGRVLLTARWRLGSSTSTEVSATYRLQKGRIIEIWTSKTNYEFILGSKARSSAAMLFIGVRIGMRARLAKLRSSH